MHIENWFPTPIFYSYAPSEVIAKIQTEYDVAEPQFISKVANGVWGDNIHTTFATLKNPIEEYGMRTLKEYVESMANNFASTLFEDKSNATIAESWVNFNCKGQYQDRHTHMPGEHIISGCYYLKTNGEDGNFRVYPASRTMEYPRRKQTKYTFSTVEYRPEVGKLLLFPSWVEHSVAMNKTEHTRISISFNINI
jgi:uncharacterized protein (TIGR02466 family)